jgi:dUTP pyrophosphatase
MSTLLIKLLNSKITDLYNGSHLSYKGDSGFDLFIPEDISILPGETKLINLGISCEMLSNKQINESFYLYPRSSISKTPLIMANSVGIIDAGYRGELKAAVKYIPTHNDLSILSTKLAIKPYIVQKNTRLFQICTKNLEPFSTKIVDTLSESTRGDNGFGSTGK